MTIFITRKNLVGNDDSVDDNIMELQIPKNRITGGKYIKQPPLVRYNDDCKSYESFDFVDSSIYLEEMPIDVESLLH